MEPKLPHNLLFMTLKEILKTDKNVKICPQNLIAFFRTHGKDIFSYTLLSYTGNSKCKLSNFASIFIDFTEWRTFLKELLKNWTSNFIFIFQTKRNYIARIWLFSLSILQINYSKNILQLQSLVSWNWMREFNCWFRSSFPKFGNFVGWPPIFDFINDLNTFQVWK